MNLLLVNPWIYDFSAFDLWAKPLGLLYIGSFMEKYGYTVSLIDCLDRCHPSVKDSLKIRPNATGKFLSTTIGKPLVYGSIPRHFHRYGIPLEAFDQDVQRQKRPDVIIITCMMTYWYLGAFEVIRRLKKAYPNTPIILGGIYARLCTKHAQHYSDADYVFESTNLTKLLQLIDSLTGISHDYKNISSDIDMIPYPAYHLYSELFSISMATSLGCPFACTYCASRFLYPTFVERTPESIFDEIHTYIKRFHIHDIAFYDDALLINAPTRFIPFAKKIIKNDFSLSFHTPNGLNISSISNEIAQLLYQSRFKTIRLSFEAAQEKFQRASSSKTTNQDLLIARDNLIRAGYSHNELEVYVMIGLPGQNMKEVAESVRFVHTAGLIIKLTEYSPLPHTVDYQEAVTRYPFIADEPLYHNNSAYSLLTDEIGHRALEDMKQYVRDLNDTIRI